MGKTQLMDNRAEKLRKLESLVRAAVGANELYDSMPDYDPWDQNDPARKIREPIEKEVNRKWKMIRTEAKALGLGPPHFTTRIIGALAQYKVLNLEERIKNNELIKLRNIGLKSYSLLLRWLGYPEVKRPKKLVCPYCGERTQHNCIKIPD